MQGKTRYFRRSHISDARFRAIIRYFAHDLSASKIAELSGVSRAAINHLFMKLRIRIAQVWNASSALSGEVEIDKFYFCARHVRGKSGAEQAVKRSSSESWNATGKCRKSSLTPPRRSYKRDFGSGSPGSIIHADGWRGYNGLVDMGYKKHFRVYHGEHEICLKFFIHRSNTEIIADCWLDITSKLPLPGIHKEP